MAPPAQTPSGAMGAIIISIKLVAISIAIAMTILLIYGFGFRWVYCARGGGRGVHRRQAGARYCDWLFLGSGGRARAEAVRCELTSRRKARFARQRAYGREGTRCRCAEKCAPRAVAVP